MNLQEAEDLAARTLAAIESRTSVFDPVRLGALDADRERVLLDLADVRDCEIRARRDPDDALALRVHSRRLDALRLASRIYGVTS